MRLLLLLLLLLCVHNCSGWRKYEEEVRLATPNEEGVYEFELLLEPKLSMSTEHEYKSLSILEYDPKGTAWLEWDKDQLKGCQEKFTLFERNHTENSSLHMFNDQMEQMLPDLVQLNGRHLRLVSVNGEVPGPTLAVPLGAEVLIRVKNRLLLDSVTIHFHGLDMLGTWYNGGVAYVQQCPIAVKSDYAFRFLADRIGTHWYHGQFPRHQDNGLLGAFVVLPKENSEEEFQELRDQGVTFDRDYVALLQDWPYQKSIEQQQGFNDNTLKWAYGFENDDEGARQKMCTEYATWHGRPDPATIPVSSIIINSKGWHSQADILGQSSKLLLTTYKVRSGETIRLRVIHGGWEQALMLHFEAHRPITIIAADGTPVRPLQVDKLMVYPGERYDLLINTLEEPARKVYRMVVRTEERFRGTSNQSTTVPLPIYGLANLEYENVDFDEVDEVDFTQQSCKQSTSGEKCVLFNCPFQPLPSRSEYTCVSVDQLEVDDSGRRMEQDVLSKKIHLAGYEEHFISIDPNTDLDGYMFLPPTKPLHFGPHGNEYTPCDEHICKRTEGLAKGQPCECFYYKRFRLGNVVQLTIYNYGTTGGRVISGKGIPKMFRTVSTHIHSTHFYVVKMGFPKYAEDYHITAMNADLPCNNLMKGCLDLKWGNSSWLYGNLPDMRRRPSLRDTVIVPFGGYTVIRFRARNPGWWLIETSNTMHNDGGTKFAFAVGTDDQMPKAPEGMPLDCGGTERTSNHSMTAYSICLYVVINTSDLCLFVNLFRCIIHLYCTL